MAQEKPNRLSEWVLLIRKKSPVVREHLADWVAEVRKEPRLLWETAAVRYTVYLVAAIALLAGTKCGVRMVTPAPPASAKEPAHTADFHVLCGDSRCAHHFVINRKFGFEKFPVACPKCKAMTGQRAVKCYSAQCQGRWVAIDDSSGPAKCARCGGALE